MNIPEMAVNEFIKKMAPIYKICLSNNKFKMPALMLWGSPGVGKSDAMKTIAKTIGEELNKEINVTDVRLLLYNPVDLRGIPTADENKEFAKWLKPKIFQMDPSNDVVNFLILDEITAAPQSVQAAAYQIVLDRQIGEHQLPDNCIIIAAGNKITDKSVSYSMPKALANRMTHIEIVPNVDDWKQWAIKNEIDPRIVGFINYKPNTLFDFDPKSQDNAYPTPRSWEMVDNYIKINNNIDEMKPMIDGTIGIGASIEFVTFCKVFNKLPDIKAIADGKYHDYPTSPDVYYALQSAIVNYCNKEKISNKSLQNILKYINGMQMEFAVLTAKDLVNSKSAAIISKIINTDEWQEFSERVKDYL